MENTTDHEQHTPWNKGVIVGQKSAFKLNEIWAIRVCLQLQHRLRELATFDLGLEGKLRACDLVWMRVRDDLPWRTRIAPSQRDARKDLASRSVRNYPTDP